MKGKILFMIVLLLVGIVHAQASFEHPGCSADKSSFCVIRTTCEISSGACSDEYVTCDICQETTKQCPDGSIARCSNTCEDSQFGLSADCTSCNAVCGNNTNIPTVVLPFDVITLKSLETSAQQDTINALAGSTAQFRLRVQNRNPFEVNVQVSANLPQGFSANNIAPFKISANRAVDLTLSIISPSDALQTSYPISVGFFTTDLREPLNFVSLQLHYNVVTQQPFTIAIDETSQQGVAGARVDYIISLTNNDPAGLGLSNFAFSAQAPRGWTARFSSSSLRVNATETRENLLSVTSPSSAEQGTYTINFNVSRGDEKQSHPVSYEISLCGNNVCDNGEEVSCSDDCVSSQFVCNGRCEQQTDSGVRISTIVQSFDMINFRACKNSASESQCIEENDCNINSDCLCSSILSSDCEFSCVDTRGAYYMLAENLDSQRIKSSSYSFACPFVNLSSLLGLRQNFENAADSYEEARSSLEERMASGESAETLRPCYDGLVFIINKAREHAAYLRNITDSPSVSGAALARMATAAVRQEIRNYYDAYCRGARGLLVVDSLTPPQSSAVGNVVTASVSVKSLGIPYYGYAKCTVTSPNNVRTNYQDACTQINGEKSYTFSFTPDRVGTWSIKCETYGTFDTECIGAEKHAESEEKSFDVYSNDIIVSAVSGSCRANTELLCYVETSPPKTCTKCSVSSIECAFLRTEGTRSVFLCPAQFSYPGVKTLRGSVFRSDDCTPASPSERTVSVSC